MTLPRKKSSDLEPSQGRTLILVDNSNYGCLTQHGSILYAPHQYQTLSNNCWTSLSRNPLEATVILKAVLRFSIRCWKNLVYRNVDIVTCLKRQSDKQSSKSTKRCIVVWCCICKAISFSVASHYGCTSPWEDPPRHTQSAAHGMWWSRRECASEIITPNTSLKQWVRRWGPPFEVGSSTTKLVLEAPSVTGVRIHFLYSIQRVTSV